MDLFSTLKFIGQTYNQARTFGGSVALKTAEAVEKGIPQVGRYLDDSFKGTKGQIMSYVKPTDKLPEDIKYQTKGFQSRLPDTVNETRQAFTSGVGEAVKTVNNLINTAPRNVNNVANFVTSNINKATGAKLPVPAYKPVFDRSDDPLNQAIDRYVDALNYKAQITDKGKDKRISSLVSPELEDTYRQYMGAKEALAYQDTVKELQKAGYTPEQIVDKMKSFDNASQTGKAFIDTAADPIQYIPGMTAADTVLDIGRLGYSGLKAIGGAAKAGAKGVEFAGKVFGNLAEGAKNENQLKEILKKRPGLQHALTGNNTLEQARMANNVATYGTQAPVGIKGSQLEITPLQTEGQLVKPTELTLKGTKTNLPTAKFAADPNVVSQEYISLKNTPKNALTPKDKTRLKELEGQMGAKVEEAPAGLIEETLPTPQSEVPLELVDEAQIQQYLTPPEPDDILKGIFGENHGFTNKVVTLDGNEVDLDNPLQGALYTMGSHLKKMMEFDPNTATRQVKRQWEMLHKEWVNDYIKPMAEALGVSEDEATDLALSTFNRVNKPASEVVQEAPKVADELTELGTKTSDDVYEQILEQAYGKDHGRYSTVHVPGAGDVTFDNPVDATLYKLGEELEQLFQFDSTKKTRVVKNSAKEAYKTIQERLITPLAKALGKTEDEVADLATHTRSSVLKHGVTETPEGLVIPAYQSSPLSRAGGVKMTARNSGIVDQAKTLDITARVSTPVVEIIDQAKNKANISTANKKYDEVSNPLIRKKLKELDEYAEMSPSLKPDYSAANYFFTTNLMKKLSPSDELALSNNTSMRLPEESELSGALLEWPSSSPVTAINDLEEGISRVSTGLHEGTHKQLHQLGQKYPNLPIVFTQRFIDNLDKGEREGLKELAMVLEDSNNYKGLSADQVMDEILAYSTEIHTVKNVPHRIIDSFKNIYKKYPSLQKKVMDFAQNVYKLAEEEELKIYKKSKLDPNLQESRKLLEYITDHYYVDHTPDTVTEYDTNLVKAKINELFPTQVAPPSPLVYNFPVISKKAK